MPRPDDLETTLESMRKELMLARCPVSGLKLLQELVKSREHADGSSLQACLRLMVKKKIDSCPELVTSRRKCRASSLTIDHVFTRQAVHQMLSMASVVAVCPREVDGRASGRFVRYKRHRDALHTMGFSASEAANDRHKNFTRVNGPVSPRLLVEHHVDSDGQVLYVMGRNAEEMTFNIVQRPDQVLSGSQTHTVEQLRRSTVMLQSVPGLTEEHPSFLRWVALGSVVCRVGSSDDDAVGRLTVSLPVRIIDDDASDVLCLLGTNLFGIGTTQRHRYLLLHCSSVCAVLACDPPDISIHNGLS